MEERKIKRFVAFFCTLILVISTFLVATGTIAHAYEQESDDIVLIERVDREDISRLDRFDLEILDRYNKNVLVELNGESIERLEDEGFRVNTLPGRNRVNVKGHILEVDEGEAKPIFETAEEQIGEGLRIETYDSGEEGLYLVHMLGPINPEWRRTLERKGLEIINYVPNYAYEVSMTPEQAEKVEDLDFIDWVGIYQPEYKLNPQLEEALDEDVPISVRLRPGFERKSVFDIESDFEVLGLEDLQEKGGRITVEIEKESQLEDLALMNDVYHISPYVEPELYGEQDSQLIGGGAWFMDDEYEHAGGDQREGDPDHPYRNYGDYGAFINQMGFTGDGVTITIADTGIGDGTIGDSGHPDLTGRVIGGYDFETGSGEEGRWGDGHGHGTHVTGSAAGDTHGGTGETFGFADYYMAQGLAYDSELFSTRIFDDGGGFLPTEYYPIVEEPAQRSDAYIHSNSWGAGTMGEYSDSDEVFDQTVRDADRDTDENRPMVITVSAGNDGGRGDYDQETGSPGNAKNVITIGATQTYNPELNMENPENMAGFSSRGWTEDNRIKPDVVAPGEGIYSLTPGGGYTEMSGTSMSNPAVAGAASVVVEWYEERYEETPSPAMVKSILINTAIDMDPEVGDTRGHIPNRDEGWGIVDISKLEAPEEEDGLGFQLEDQEDLIETGDVDEFEVRAVDEDEPLKITLSWTDKNALEGDSSGGTPTLKNNLDLEVESPSGDIYRGNAFDESGDGVSDSGFTYPNTDAMSDFDYNGDGWDDVNNVNNIYIHPDDIEDGDYTVRVIGTNVPEDANNDGQANQDYALTASNVPDDVELDIVRPDKEGEIQIERDEYAGNDVVNITLDDIILEGEGTHEVSVSSLDADGNEMQNMTVELVEHEEELGFFEGQVQLSEDGEEGTLEVTHDGEIVAWYWDADPGHPDDLEDEEEDTYSVSGSTGLQENDLPRIAVVDEIDYHEGEIAAQLEAYLEGPHIVDTLEADELIDEMENYDVFVPWRFGSDSLAEDFLDELTDDQSAVYLDSEVGATDEGYGDAITRLHNVREDPAEHWADSGTNSPIEIEITQDHEIFDGIGEVGDVVTLLESGTIYGSHYDEYSGDDLALVRYDGEYEGQGVGIDEDGNEILLAAKNIDFFASPDDPAWTEESWTLLANSVSYFTEMPDNVVGVSEISEPPERVNTEESHAVETLVSNLGDNDYEDVLVETTINHEAIELHEDFEDEIPGDWTIDNTTEEPATWHHDGDMAFVDGVAEIDQDEWLITPELDMSEARFTTLRFDHDFYTSGVSGDSWGRVHVTSDGGDTWELIDEWEPEESVDGVFEYDISEYADEEEQVQVGFQWDSSGDPDNGDFDDWEIYEVEIEYMDEIYYDETEIDVDAGEDVTAFFEDWNPDEEGNYLMESTTEDLNDDIIGYGTTQEIIVEDVHGVQVSELVSPPEIGMIDEVHDVIAEIENYGTFDEEDIPVEVYMDQIHYFVEEDFQHEIPDDWTINETADETWHHSYDDWDGPMARVQDDGFAVQEEWLITPEFEASEAEETELFIDHDFSDGFYGDPYGEIAITTDGGDTWQEIDNFTDDESGETIYDISDHADGEESVQIGFYFETEDHGDDPWTPDSWEIYEVSISSVEFEYQDDTTIDIDAQEFMEVEFEEWDPEYVSEYEVTVSTELNGETHEIVETIYIRAPEANLGIDEIISPEDEVWEETQEVEAQITNYGDFAVEEVPVQATAEYVDGFVEDFSGEFPPDGWETDDWTQSDSNEAGGTSPEANLYWFDVGDDDYSYLQSPAVDTTDADELALEFFSYLDHNTAEFTAQVQVRSSPDESWQDVTPWDNPVSSTIAPSHYEVDISEHIGPETQVIFEYYGSTSELQDWFVNDVVMGERVEDYSDVIEVNLDEDETITTLFEDWTPSQAGDYIFNVTAMHPDETEPDSATLKQFTEVRPIIYDLEATSIDEPVDPIWGGEENEVVGTVTNVGNQYIEEADVDMRIDQVISDTPIDEDFSSDPTENGWEVVDKDGNDNTWEWDETSESMIITPEDDLENDVLWTEIADCTDGEYRVMLEFFSDHRGVNDRTLLISNDGGESYRRLTSNVTEGPQEFDITQWAGEEEEVMIGWEFFSENVGENDYWEIDDVSITTEYLVQEYVDEVTIEELDVEEESQVNFTDWVPGEYPSDYIMTMTTDHQEDDNMENVEISRRVFADEYEEPVIMEDPNPYDGEENVHHSPVFNITVYDPNGYDMDVTFYLFDEDGNEIGNQTHEEVVSGELATTQFVLIETDSTFEWHVEVDDGVNTVISDTWQFHTYEPEGRYVSDSADINTQPPEQVENLELDWDAGPWDVTGNELTWDASQDDGQGNNDTEYYAVYRAADEDGPWDETTMIDTVEADGSDHYSYLDEGMANDGEQWHYVVRAVDRVGNMDMNEDSVHEMPLPDASNPTPDDGEWLEGLEHDLSVDVTNPTEEQMNVEFYDGNTNELIDSFEVVEDGRIETTWELEETRMAQDNYWYVLITYDGYNMGSINPEEYTLDVNTMGQGTVDIEPEQDSYLEGTEVELEATPDSGWTFQEWTGDYEGTESQISIVMEDDYEITANFEYLGDLEGEWRWLYDADHRPDEADNALSSANPQVWYGGMILDLSDDVGGYITDVAYLDFDATANYVQAHVAEDDGGAPGEWIASSEEYTPVGGETWAELELTDDVSIQNPGDYWIVIEIDDPSEDDLFPFGTIDPDVQDGQWINFDDPHDAGDWDEMTDLGINTAWGLEAYVESPVDDNESEAITTDHGLTGNEVEVAVVDPDNYHDYEIQYKLEDYLPEGEYNVDTLWNEDDVHWQEWLIDEMDNYDVFVIQRFEYTNEDSEAAAADFLDELQDGQGVVYLDTHVGGTQQAYSDGVTRLHEVRGDPVTHDSSATGTSPPQYLDIWEDHPIFEDVGEAGDEVLMFDGTTNWGSWFDDYSGEILAEKDYGGGYAGPAVGVCDEKNEVLLPAKGIGFFGNADDTGWTEEANQMFANAVDYVADPTPEQIGWHFHIEDDMDPHAEFTIDEELEYYQGDTITLNATHSYNPPSENTGIENYTWDIEDPYGEMYHFYEPIVEKPLEYALYYDITLTVTDAYGNSAQAWDEIYAIDTEDPVADAGTSSQTRVGVEHTLECFSTDNVGVVEREWVIEGTSGNAEGYEDTLTVEEETVDYVFQYEGSYEVTLTASDEMGNNDSDQITVFVNPPVDAFDIVTPAEDYQTIEEDTVLVEWQGHEYMEDIVYEIRINYGDWDTVGSDTDYTFVGLDDGTHVVQVRAFDADGNSYTQTRIFEVDTMDEEIEIISPENGVESMTFEDEFTITGQTDPELDVYINGESVPVDDAGGFEYTTTLIDGQNVFRVTAENEDEVVAETTVYALYMPDIPELYDEIDELNSEMEQLDEDISDLNQLIDDMQDDLEDMETDISELESDIANLQSELNELEDELATLQSELEARLDELEAAIEENSDDIDDIMEDIDDIRSDIDDLEPKIQDVETHMTTIEASLGDTEEDQSSEISTARTLGMVGLLIGVIALVIAVFAMNKSGEKTQVSEKEQQHHEEQEFEEEQYFEEEQEQ